MGLAASTTSTPPQDRDKLCGGCNIDNREHGFDGPFRTIRTDGNGPFLLLVKATLQPPHTTEEVLMWCWRPPQINTHQVYRDQLVAPRTRR